MIKKIVNFNLKFIELNLGINDYYKLDRIRYGLEVFFGELIKFMIILTMSIAIKKVNEFFIILFMLISIRCKIGGTHARSFNGCLVKSIIKFLFLYCVGDLVNIPEVLVYIIIFLTIIVLFKLKYKTKVGNINDSQMDNRLKVEVVSAIVISMILIKKYLYSYYNLLLITQLYILLDYLKIEFLRKDEFYVKEKSN